MYFNELLTYEEIQEKYQRNQHDAICYLLKGGLFQDMSEIIERIEALEERADTTDGTIAQIQIDIEDLKQRMTEVETTVVQIMEKFDDYYTKTEIDATIRGVLDTHYTKAEIDAMLSAIDPGIVDRINPGITTQQGFFNVEIEVE